MLVLRPVRHHHPAPLDHPRPVDPPRRVRTLGHRPGPSPRPDHRGHQPRRPHRRRRPLGRAGRSAPPPLLHAAAGINVDISWVLRWVLRREVTEPLRALGATIKTELAKETLVGIAETDERERSGIFSTAARILSAYRHQHTLNAAAQPNFDPGRFVRTADTLYLVAPSHHQTQLAPIVVCLLDQIRHATYTRTANPPPVIFALDEVANIAPLPDLPAIVAEGASQGLVTLACLQDLHQARTRWGPAANGFLTLFAANSPSAASPTETPSPNSPTSAAPTTSPTAPATAKPSAAAAGRRPSNNDRCTRPNASTPCPPASPTSPTPTTRPSTSPSPRRHPSRRSERSKNASRRSNLG